MTKIYLIPYWVTDALTRHRLEASSIFDIDKLRQYLSVTDIAGIIATQNLADHIFGQKNIDFNSNIFYEWSVRATPQDVSFLDSQVAPLSKDESVIESEA